jgi:Protein of unknown function (DUF3347)
MLIRQTFLSEYGYTFNFAKIFYIMVKRILLLVLVLLLAVAGYVWYKFSTEKGGGFEGEKAKKLEINSTTPVFDKGFEAVLSNYLSLKDAFVEADTAAAKAANKKLISSIDSLKLDEIKKDTASAALATTVETFLGDVKNNATRINDAATIKDMRLAFFDASQQLYPLLKSIKYKGGTLYWQSCPMAFDGDKEANWFDTKGGMQRTNPYLGKKDEKYGAGMLHCGEDKDSVLAK